MCKHDITKNGTRLVLAFVILTLVFVQTFGIAPKDNPVRAQSVQWTYVGQSVPDGTCFIPNTAITVTWTVQLTGTGYGFTFVSGPVSNVSTSLSTGQNVTLTATFTTPSSVGDFRVDFKIIDANGNTISSTKGSSTLWLTFKVADNCNANNSAPVQNSDNQPATSGGHWIETPEQSHQVCKINTWFGCWWWEKVIDIPASRTWVADPTPIPAETQPPAPVTIIEIQPPVATVQIAPSGACTNLGETQIGNGWTVVCLGNVWMNATVDPSGNTVVPVPVPTAPSATPIPGNAPRSFNGVSLPTTSDNMISGGGVMLYMFAGSMTLPANYVIVAEGTAYTTLSAAGTSVVSVVSACTMPLVIIGVAFFIAYGINALIAVPAGIVHPPAVPVQVAPMSFTVAASNPAYGLNEAYAAVSSMESLIGFSVTDKVVSTMTLPISLGMSGDQTVTLPNGTVVTLSYLEGSGFCNHKSEMKIHFPWGDEIFQGFSNECGPWGMLEALVEMLLNWSNRVMRFWKNPLLVNSTQAEVYALKSMIEVVTEDLIKFVVNLIFKLIGM